MNGNNTTPTDTRGLLLAFASYGLWGCFPLFFHLLAAVAPLEVLAHRTLWACLFLLLTTLITRQFSALLAILRSRRALFGLGVSAAFIALNWLVFIWAVSQHRILEASLGYFMTPLVSLVLGWLFLNERLGRLQWGAALLAVCAVVFELWSLGSLPWITLVLACSFGFYGLIRKRLAVSSLHGLTVETLILAPAVVVYLTWQHTAGTPAFGHNLQDSILLVVSGVLTALPLMLFAAAAHRLDLTVVGFIMYLNPTVQFLTAVFILGETFPPQRLVTFVLIWLAMALFLAGLWRARQRRQFQRT